MGGTKGEGGGGHCLLPTSVTTLLPTCVGDPTGRATPDPNKPSAISPYQNLISYPRTLNKDFVRLSAYIKGQIRV